MSDYQDFQKFRDVLQQMGVNPDNLNTGQGSPSGDSALPPLPPSDPGAMNRNYYDGFYKRASREFWGESQVTQTKLEDFKKCEHYLMKTNNEARCNKCHVGWIVPDSFHIQDGKLFDGETQLQFAH